jgi:hypothetical protein
MILRAIPFLVFTGVLLAGSTAFASGQDEPVSRNLVNPDFVKARPAGSRPSVRPKNYKFGYVRSVRDPLKRKVAPSSATSPVKTSKPDLKMTEIGVTMWKLRAPRSGESGYLFPVVDADQKRQMWLAERVSIDTTFTAGEKVRFAIESSVRGYLYVIDRESSSDGGFGAPFLLFPESPRDDNSVGPGILIDIPDQREDVPYFNINPKQENYSGELLTIIISPEPLMDLRLNEDGSIAATDALSAIEFGAETEVFSRADTTDRIYSQLESSSACGTKARQLEREKTPAKPCGPTTRQLTRDEPLPQSIFRAKAAVGKPAVVFVQLRAKK